MLILKERVNFSAYTTIKSEEILKKLSSSRNGLTEKDVQKRQKSFGLNALKGEEIRWYHILLRQFRSPFLYLLIGASLLSFILKEMLDSLMILFFVGINSSLGFSQEFRSENTLKLLKQYVVSKSKVIRNGKEELIPSSQLVMGDLIILQPGDIIPADIRFTQTQSVTIDESILTGESIAVTKTDDVLPQETKEIYQAKNIGFSGTNLVAGEGLGIVIATGANTQIGKIASLTAQTKHNSSFEKGISKLSVFILKIIIVTLILIVVINLLIKGSNANIPTLIIFSIALAISVIPEALPVVTTFSFSKGALRLAKKDVVVKRLSSIEDLGSVEVLCTDKTGTITQNLLTVDGYYPKKNDALFYASLATPLLSKSSALADPFDIAITNALSSDERKKIKDFEKLKEIPFDPKRRRNTVLAKINNKKEVIVRGALESILPLCKKNHISFENFQNWSRKEGVQGKRVLAVAKKTLSNTSLNNLEEKEKDLDLVGLLSFVDPLKKTSKYAIGEAKKLGVKVKILTGDSREVAGNVASQIGLIDNTNEVLTGDELDLSPPDKQHEMVESFSVFARVSPEQKHKIIQLLQEKHEVGFLGEGINDAPALRAANVAIVVQGASDIAREAADIVLLNKSLHVIVDGIKEGRIIFGNTAKYIKATLASNFGNFYTVAISSLFINFLPLLPLQILLINLLTDFPMIAVATDNVDQDDLKRPRNYDVKEIALFATIMGIVSSVFDFLFFVLFFRISPQVLQTSWFIGSVLTELLFLFSIRTRLPIFKAVHPSTPLLALSAFAFLTAIVLPFTAIGRKIFEFVTPTPAYLYTILLITVSYFVITEVVKNMYYKFTKL